jgi:hypothetical protein
MSAVYENNLSVSAMLFNAGKSDACVLVRATLFSSPRLATCMSCGFDLSAEGALKLAECLTKLAGELQAAEVTR